MAHFAKISETNEVLSVHVVNNSDILNTDGVEDETVGQVYLEQHSNWPSHLWIQTSYNTSGGVHKKGGTPLRGNYASTGHTWDEDNASASWKSPIGDAPALTAEQILQNTPVGDPPVLTHKWYYVWNEANTTWDLTDSKA